MQLNYDSEFRGPPRASKLGLTSQRFQESHMSKHAKEAVEEVKAKDRSYLKLGEWREKKYYKSDATRQLRSCMENIERCEADELSVRDFVERFQKTGKPVIIRGCTKEWNLKKWSFQALYEEYKDAKFKIGEDDDGYKLRVPFKYYLEYLINNKDDSPLYLFESSIEDHKEAHRILNNYQVPPYFKDDLFKLAGEKRRPPYRWLIIGPQRSGTTVHIDPLMTSAWNCSLAGYKRWVCFDACVPKTIVKGKQFRCKGYEDEAINYFVQILPKIKQKYSKEQLGLIEFVQGPGQTVFIPGGVWHAVVNLTDSIAVTQNVMTHFNFTSVWRSTRSERPKFAKRFLEDMKTGDKQMYERAVRLNKEDEFKMGERYRKQSVSLSFSSSSRSSSSSSSSSSNSSRQSRSGSPVNKVQLKRELRSMSRSRSRDKGRRTRSEGKNSSRSKRST